MIAIGVIGYGYWGPNLVRNFTETPGARVAWVTDLSPQRIAPVPFAISGDQGEHRLPRHARGPGGRRGRDCDARSRRISSWRMAALRAGKHVLVEKPMASSTEEAARLIEEADRRGLVLMVDHTFVFTPAPSQKMRELRRSGELGDLYYYDSVRINLGLFQHDVNVLWDLAVHDLSIMDFVVGPRSRSPCPRPGSRTCPASRRTSPT